MDWMFEAPQKDLFFLSFSPAINKNRERGKRGTLHLWKWETKRFSQDFAEYYIVLLFLLHCEGKTKILAVCKVPQQLPSSHPLFPPEIWWPIKHWTSSQLINCVRTPYVDVTQHNSGTINSCPSCLALSINSSWVMCGPIFIHSVN